MEYAKQHGYEEVAKIDMLSTDNNTGRILVTLTFFRSIDTSSNGETVKEGQIGIPGEHATFYLHDNVRPLNVYILDVPFQDLTRLAERRVCQQMRSDNPWFCKSCDPSGNLFPENEWSTSRDYALQQITNIDPEKPEKNTVFVCPSQITRAGEPLSQSDASCRLIVIRTVKDASGTNRYSLIGIPSENVLKSAFLEAYQMPQTSTYLNAIPWSSLPQWTSLKEREQNLRIACLDMDYLKLYTLIGDLLGRGYRMQTIALNL